MVDSAEVFIPTLRGRGRGTMPRTTLSKAEVTNPVDEHYNAEELDYLYMLMLPDTHEVGVVG